MTFNGNVAITNWASGKVAIVTGASSGIGAATAIALAREGVKIALVARNELKLREVAKRCEEHGTKPLIIKADVSKDEDVRTIAEKTIDHFGQLDVLVNNAGIPGISSILDDKVLECYDKVMNTNLRSAVLLTHLAAPHLIKTKGNIVNISSMEALRVSSYGIMPYSVSKAGMDHFTRCIALELAPHGVRVNSINPGYVKTNIFANGGLSDVDVQALLASVTPRCPLNKIAEPEEIADLVLFLVSDKARSITGSSLVSDNGFILK